MNKRMCFLEHSSPAPMGFSHRTELTLQVVFSMQSLDYAKPDIISGWFRLKIKQGAVFIFKQDNRFLHRVVVCALPVFSLLLQSNLQGLTTKGR